MENKLVGSLVLAQGNHLTEFYLEEVVGKIRSLLSIFVEEPPSLLATATQDYKASSAKHYDRVFEFGLRPWLYQ